MVRFLFLLVLAFKVSALVIEPDININTETLKPEQREELFNLKERLEAYLTDEDWDPEEEHLRIGFPLAIQFRTAIEVGAGWEYTALFASGNKSDINFDESAWRFQVPSGRLEFNQDVNDSFLAMINYHLFLIIGYEYDRLGEFAGEEFFQRARQTGMLARLDERSDGWDRRMQTMEELLDPRNQNLRSLRWVTHTAFWFRSVMKNDYEAWKAIRLALDIAEEIDNPGKLSGWFKANYESIVEILVKGKDQDALFLLMRLDNLDPQRTEYYQEQLLRFNR
jgi:hypothetical protein